MRRTTKAITATLLLLVLLGAQAQPMDAAGRNSATVEVTALAVAETPDGLQGVSASIRATVLSHGSGDVFVSTKPLAATDMQGSARLAAQVASQLLGVEMHRQDHLVAFTSTSTVIGGPSAGAVMTTALATALHNVLEPEDPWTLDARVAATGTINPDGSIGPVGGVPQKAEAAAEAGVTLFLYPSGLDQATTYERGPFGLRPVVVDMQQHCRALEIECRPAAHVREVLEAATGVRLVVPDPVHPTTAAYSGQLAPSVEAQLEALSARLRDAPMTPDAAQGAYDQAIDEAHQRLADARQALAQDLYYQAATWAFQGHIHAAWAQELASLHADTGDLDGGALVVHAQGRADACRDAGSAALQAVQETPSDMHAVYALAAAQDRAVAARALAAQAEAAVRSARVVDDLHNALFTVAFCLERVQTVHWWAGLRDAFGPGPAIDVAAVLEDALERAEELVAYAEAVTEGGAAGAAGRLDEARQMQGEALSAGALVAAVEAQSMASVTVQSAAGAEVPEEVLAAARDGAARAIATARLRGVEPLLPVSLVELAATQTAPRDALEALWTARSLALLDAPIQPVESRSRPVAAAYDESSLLAFLSIGAVLGAAVVAAAWSITPRR